MKSLLTEIAVFILSSIAACIIIIFAVPLAMFINIYEAYEAYEEDRASSKLHQDINDFLREQRGQDTDDYYQMHTW